MGNNELRPELGPSPQSWSFDSMNLQPASNSPLTTEFAGVYSRHVWVKVDESGGAVFQETQGMFQYLEMKSFFGLILSGQ